MQIHIFKTLSLPLQLKTCKIVHLLPGQLELTSSVHNLCFDTVISPMKWNNCPHFTVTELGLRAIQSYA